MSSQEKRIAKVLDKVKEGQVTCRNDIMRYTGLSKDVVKAALAANDNHPNIHRVINQEKYGTYKYTVPRSNVEQLKRENAKRVARKKDGEPLDVKYDGDGKILNYEDLPHPF